MTPHSLTEIPEDIREAANHGLLYPNILQPAWEKHGASSFQHGADAREKSIMNKLRKALQNYDGKPEQLAEWLSGFTKQ